MLLGKRIEDINESDIKFLIDMPKESIYYDFKRELNFQKDKEKGEFLADIVAFANTHGGDLIIGIEENNSSFQLCGFDIAASGYANLGILQQSIDQLCQSCIEPSLPGIVCHLLTMSGENKVLIVRVPRSMIAPHRVKYKNASQNHMCFYGRSDTGNYQMSVYQIKEATISQYNLTQEFLSFKKARLGIIQEERICSLPPEKQGAMIIIHLIPITALQKQYSQNVQGKIYNRDLIEDKLPPLSNSRGSDFEITFDGALITRKQNGQGVSSYSLLMRNGVVEIVDLEWLQVEAERGERNNIPSKLIPYPSLPDRVKECLRKYLELYGDLNIPFPIYFCMSILDVNGYTFLTASGGFTQDLPLVGHPKEIKRNILVFPDHEIITKEQLIEKVNFNMEILANAGNCKPKE